MFPPMEPTRGDGQPPSPFEYPVSYPVKIIGLAADDFADHARALVERAVGAAVTEPSTCRSSGGGRYLAVTVVVTVTSEAHRLAIYAALRADARVVFAL